MKLNNFQLQLWMDRRLAKAVNQAALQQQVGSAAEDSISAALAALTGKPAPQPAAAAPSAAPRRLSGVGEQVWQPAVVSPLASSAAPSCVSTRPIEELLRRQAIRRLQAAAESLLIDLLGDEIVSRLEMKSSVTLRNGNGLMERWGMCRHLSAGAATAASAHTPSVDPLLPPPYSKESEAEDFCAELVSAGASAVKAAEATRALGSEAGKVIRWVRMQRPRAEPRVFIRPKRHAPPAVGAWRGGGFGGGGGGGGGGHVADETVEVVCGKAALPLSKSHLEKLRELYARRSGREVSAAEQPFQDALFCLLQRCYYYYYLLTLHTRPHFPHMSHPMLPIYHRYILQVRERRWVWLPGGAQRPRVRCARAAPRVHVRVLRLAPQLQARLTPSMASLTPRSPVPHTANLAPIPLALPISRPFLTARSLTTRLTPHPDEQVRALLLGIR